MVELSLNYDQLRGDRERSSRRCVAVLRRGLPPEINLNRRLSSHQIASVARPQS